MAYWRLLIVFILPGLLMGCVGSLGEKSYLQQYGSPGGKGQGFRRSPYRVSEEAHKCLGRRGQRADQQSPGGIYFTGSRAGTGGRGSNT